MASLRGRGTVLPAQDGNSGKFLGTNGTVLSWEDALPTQTNNSGKILVSNGTASLWSEPLGGMGRQAIIDGNLDICQISPVVATTVLNPATGTYPKFDMWKVEYSADGGTLPSNIIHSQTQVTMGDLIGGKYCMRINPDGAGSGFGNGAYYRMSHYILSGTRNLCGLNQTVTIQFKLRSSIANKKIGVRIIQNYGTGGSPSADEVLTGTTFSLTSNLTLYTHTFVTNSLVGKTFGTGNDDYLKVEIYEMWGSNYNTSLGAGSAETFVGSGTIDIAQIQLNRGNIAFSFLIESGEKVLTDCCRWYRKGFPYSIAPADGTGIGIMRMQTFETNAYHELGAVDFSSNPMARTPVIGFYNPAVSDANNKIRNYTDLTNHPAVAGNVGTYGFYIAVNNSSIASGKKLVTLWDANARFL
jgi:hypothetical protein